MTKRFRIILRRHIKTENERVVRPGCPPWGWEFHKCFCTQAANNIPGTESALEKIPLIGIRNVIKEITSITQVLSEKDYEIMS